MSSFAAAGFVVFILVLFAGIYLGLFGLPGAVVIFLDVLVYALVTGFAQVGWKVMLFLLFAAVLAEAFDFWADSQHLAPTPATGASLGSAAVGAAAGMVILTPLLWSPGIWLGFFLGGLAGLLLAERRRQSRLSPPPPSQARAFLTLIGLRAGKGFLSLVMIFVSLSNIYS